MHGTYGACKIVRYDRAGKWYLERPDGSRLSLTVRQAADFVPNKDQWNKGLYGGKVFDALVAKRLDKRA